MGSMNLKRREVITGATATVLASTTGKKLMAASNQSFIVPAEEEKHQRTFMQWPVSRSVYPRQTFRNLVQKTIAEIANTISEFEPVVMLASQTQHEWARQYLSDAVELWDIPTEDLWCRDSGPLFARRSDGGLVVSHIQFNGWGNRQTHVHDGRVAERVAERLGLELVPSGLRGEPGGAEQDGNGLLMAHESSWIHENRNPGLPRGEVQQRLLNAYGAKRMIWAPGLRDEDITDYHIDGLARFTGPGKVLINLPKTPDPDEPFHQAALETRRRLTLAGLDVDEIPEPVTRRNNSYEFVASYVNYYVCNGGVIASQFGDDETDEIAREALRRHYPGREVVMLNADPLGELGGGIHCATQQMPAV